MSARYDCPLCGQSHKTDYNLVNHLDLHPEPLREKAIKALQAQGIIKEPTR